MKKILCFIFTFMIGIMCASALTDFSGASFDFEGATDTDQSDVSIKIKGATLTEGTNYEYLITHSNTDSVIKSSYTVSEIVSLTGYSTGSFNGKISNTTYSKEAEKAGDLYVTIYEEEDSVYKKASDPILVKRIDNLPLTKRMNAYLFEDETSIYLWNLNSVLTERKVNYKLGLVEDNSILNKVKENKQTGFEDLLNYAKNKESIKSGNVNLTHNLPALFSQTDIAEGKYYYLYLDIDTENGKYYSLDDIQLYQALKTSDDKLWLCQYGDDRFSWSVDDSTKQIEEKATVDNPNTGIRDYTIISLIIVSIGLVVYSKIRKYSKFPQAK